jgi:hypothetical protein
MVEVLGTASKWEDGSNRQRLISLCDKNKSKGNVVSDKYPAAEKPEGLDRAWLGGGKAIGEVGPRELAPV